jgi:hypothetical protein
MKRPGPENRMVNEGIMLNGNASLKGSSILLPFAKTGYILGFNLPLPAETPLYAKIPFRRHFMEEIQARVTIG